MTDAELIRNLEPYMPLHIQVQCYRGHFMANMTLNVRDGQLTVRQERSRNDLRDRASKGRGDFNAEVHVTPNSGTVLECTNSKCKYRPERNMQGLAEELARAALRARLTDTPAVHRLTD